MTEKSAGNLMDKAHAAPRCRAKSKRSGERCKCAAVRGKNVCRMHGAYAGAPRGPSHGMYKHGRFTCEAIDARRQIAKLIADARRTAITIE